MNQPKRKLVPREYWIVKLSNGMEVSFASGERDDAIALAKAHGWSRYNKDGPVVSHHEEILPEQ